MCVILLCPGVGIETVALAARTCLALHETVTLAARTCLALHYIIYIYIKDSQIREKKALHVMAMAKENK